MSRLLARYAARPDLNARMPGFAVQMGFGLHVGWAIEGAIGAAGGGSGGSLHIFAVTAPLRGLCCNRNTGVVCLLRHFVCYNQPSKLLCLHNCACAAAACSIPRPIIPQALSTRLTPATCRPTLTWPAGWRRPPSSTAPRCCSAGTSWTASARACAPRWGTAQHQQLAADTAPAPAGAARAQHLHALQPADCSLLQHLLPLTVRHTGVAA